MFDWLQTQGQGLVAGYELVKAIHLMAVIFWVAGLLMLPRLFVYHHQAETGGEAERILTVAEGRLAKLIVLPAMIVTWVLGLAMLALNTPVLSQGWMHLKLVLVVLLSGYHGFLAGQTRRFASGDRPFSEKTWRFLNEVPALATIFVVLLAIVKPF